MPRFTTLCVALAWGGLMVPAAISADSAAAQSDSAPADGASAAAGSVPAPAPADNLEPPVPAAAGPAGEPTVADLQSDDLVDSAPTGSEADQPPAAVSESPASKSQKIEPEPELYWHEDYGDAWREAKEDGRMLLIYFHDTRSSESRRTFEERTLTSPEIRAKLADFVLLKLPVDAVVEGENGPVKLLKHSSFVELLNRPGLAILDFAHPKTEYYGQLVSAFPLAPGKYYRGPSLSTILTLPPGTLTQRTMIYAVRTHPEAPKSTQGQFNGVLAEEADKHSVYQAAILVQGHHNWEHRIHRINARLPGGAAAEEVVAESWPNESLVDACVDCVHSWRQSPGHWNAVRSRHSLFGFDIKRGRNGIWYATGIFGRR